MLRLILFLLAALAAIGGSAQNTLSNPPNAADGLKIVEGSRSLLAGASLNNVKASADGKSVELADGALAGSITLAPFRTDFPFNEAIPSWNGWAGGTGGFEVWIAPISGGRQAEWINAGSWGTVAAPVKSRDQMFSMGRYLIDYFVLNQPADGVLVRFDIERQNPNEPSPRIRLFALSFSETTGRAAQFAKPANAGTIARNINIKVPYHSQVVASKSLVGKICAPCSVVMSLEAYGIPADTETMARAVYDQPSDAFGVWNRSIQGGAQMGLRGYLTRFRNFNDVAQALAKNQVISASIRFEPGEVQDPLRKHNRRKEGTKGHLVIVKGLTQDGNVIVHDTSSKDYGVDMQWKQSEFAKAWFDKGGVAYVFTGRASKSN
jgi:hypothetical protein